jgi:hypothetical protein
MKETQNSNSQGRSKEHVERNRDIVGYTIVLGLICNVIFIIVSQWS